MQSQSWLRILVLALAAIGSSPAGADTFPNRMITIVVPFPPGGGADVIARVIAQRLAGVLQQKVVVENKPGANGAIGATAVARATPDGHTLFFATNTAFSANPNLTKTIAYDPIKDFVPISRIGTFVFVLIVNAQMPVRTVQDLITYAKANPGKLSLASTTSTSLIAAESLKRLAGVDIVVVPQRGGATNDVLGGHVTMTITDLTTALPHVKSGAVRALAVTSRERSALMPDVPSFHEAGLLNFDVTPWGGMFVPAGTPPEAIARLNAELRAIIDDLGVKSQLGTIGFDAFSSTSEELGRLVESELLRWREMIKDAGIEPQ